MGDTQGSLKDNQLPEGVMVGSNKQSLHAGGHSSKGKIKIILPVVVVLLVVGGIVTYLLVRHHDDTASHNSKTTADTSLNNLPPAARYHALATEGDYVAEQQALSTQATNAKDPAERSNIYLQQAALALRFSNYEDAKMYTGQAQQLTPSSSLPFAMLAKIAAAQGDTKTAATNWQAAIDHLDKSSKQYAQLLKQYQTELQGGGS